MSVTEKIAVLFFCMLATGGCYNSKLVASIDYGLSLLPEAKKPARFEHQSMFLEKYGEGPDHRIICVFVSKPDWSKMRAFARQQRQIYKRDRLTVFFFASELSVPDISRDGRVPESARPYLGGRYKAGAAGESLDRFPDAFDLAMRQYADITLPAGTP